MKHSCLILSLCLLLGACGGGSGALDFVKKDQDCDHLVDLKLRIASGLGDADDPLYICKAEDLNEIDKLTSDLSFRSMEKHYILKKDIDLSNHDPLGNEAFPFGGSLDGDGHTVTLKITATGKAEMNVGLFGYTRNASIKNLKVKGNIKCDNCGLSKTDIYIGGVIGRDENYAGFENVVFEGTISCDHSHDVNCTVGGLIGEGGKVNNSRVDATISCKTNKDCTVGGLVGNKAQSIKQSYIRGTLQGNAAHVWLAGLYAGSGGEITNSVAWLTAYKTNSSSATLNRITTSNSSTLNNNYALDDSAHSWDKVNPNEADGATVDATDDLADENWWKSSVKWDFDKTWKWDGAKPVLKFE